MVQKFLNTNTLTLGDRNAAVTASYQSKSKGAYTSHFLVELKKTNATLEELLGLTGQDSWVEDINKSLSSEEFKALFDFITRSLGSAVSLAKIKIANEKISIGNSNILEVACSSLNITYDNRGAAGKRLVIQTLTSDKKDAPGFYLDVSRKGTTLTAFTFEGNLRIFGLGTRFAAVYSPAEGWEFQFNTKKGEVIPIADLLQKFLEGFSLQVALPKLDLYDVLLVWNPKGQAILGASADIGPPGANASAHTIKLRAEIDVSETRGIAFDFSYNSNGTPISLADMAQKLPVQLDGLQSALPSQLYTSIGQTSLHRLQASLDTIEKEFCFAAAGEILGIRGEVGFSISNFSGQRMLAFHVFGDVEHNLKSIPDILTNTLGIHVSSDFAKYLPKVKFALAELSFDQMEERFALKGVIASSDYDIAKNKGYRLESSLEVEWQDGIRIDLEMNAEEAPLTLIALAEDLPFTLDTIKQNIPAEVVDKIGATAFHSLEIHLDTAQKEFSIEGVANLFGRLLVEGSFSYSAAAGLKFDVSVCGEPLSLGELADCLGIQVDKASLPTLILGLEKLYFDQAQRKFLIQGAIIAGEGRGELELHVELPAEGGAQIYFLYTSEESSVLTVGQLVEGAVPASLHSMLPATNGQESTLLKNLKASYLEKLHFELNTREKELYFFAAGQLLGLKGEVSFSISSPSGAPMVSFLIRGDVDANLRTIPELLENTLGINLSTEVKKYLPNIKFALAELSFDQIEGKFALQGIIQSSVYDAAKKTGYRLECSLEVAWQGNIRIELSVDAGDIPLTLAALKQDLPFSLDGVKSLIPENVLQQIEATRLHRGSVIIDTTPGQENIMIEGVTSLFGELPSTTTFELFNEKDGKFLRAPAEFIGQEPRPLREVPKLIGMIGKDENPEWLSYVPDLYIRLDEFMLDQKSAKFIFEGLVVFKNVSISAGFSLARMNPGLMVNIFFRQSGDPVSLIELLNEAIPGANIPALPANLDLILYELDVSAYTNPKGMSGKAKGAIRLLNTELVLTAESKTAADPWDFSLKTAAEGINLIELGKQLLGLQSIQLPLNLSSIIVTIDTCTFTSQGAFRLKTAANTLTQIPDQKHLSVALSIDLERLPKKKITGRLNGMLTYSGMSFALDLNLGEQVSTLTAIAKNIDLAKLTKDLTGVELAAGIPRITIETLSFALSSDKAIAISGRVSGDWDMPIGDASLKIKEAVFEFKRSKTGSISCLVDMEGSGQWNADLKFPRAKFHFSYNETAGWKLSGDLSVEAMGRYLNFKAKATSLAGSSNLSFSANFDAVVYDRYFKDIKDLDTEKLLKKLETLKAVQPSDAQGIRLLTAGTNADKLNLGTGFTAEQKKEIVETLKKIQSGNALHIPDFEKLTQNPNIASFALRSRSLSVDLALVNGALSSLDMRGSADFTIWNPLLSENKLLTIENGTLAFTLKDGVKTLTFSSDKAEFEPLAIIPGLPPALQQGLVAGLGTIEIKKDQQQWSLSADAYLQVNETALKELPGADLITELFPTPQDGKPRRLTGKVSFSSKTGTTFTLTNEAFALTPNPSAILKGALTQMIDALRTVARKESEKELLKGLENSLKQFPETGRAYFCLQEIAITLHRKDNSGVSVKLGVGLPERLNELLFGRFSDPLVKKLNGVLRTYNPTAGKTADSLMVATLQVTQNGISGSLDGFPPINWAKLDAFSDELKKRAENGIRLIMLDGKEKKITDKDIARGSIKSIIFDFDGLAAQPKDTYGAIAIDVPRLGISFKSGSFSIRGGCRVLSKKLAIPLPFKSICQLFGLPQIGDYMPETIPVRSVSFIENGKFNLNDLESHLLDSLPAKFKQPEELSRINALLKPFKDAVNGLGGAVISRFPDRFKEYLGVYLPQGFAFEINVTADQSVSFALEVASSTYKITQQHINTLKTRLPQAKAAFWSKLDKLRAKEIEYENKPALRRALIKSLSHEEWENSHGELMAEMTAGNFHDALQTIAPMGPSGKLLGLRLRRIAFGTALFNQVFRVDFSGEIDQFDLLELVPALALPGDDEIKDETARMIVPGRDQLKKSFLFDQLVIFIIYQSGVPIPVPVYAREADMNNANLLGDANRLRWNIEANAGIVTVLKKLIKLPSFFTKPDSWLPLQSYPLGSNDAPPELALELGPNYFKFPGILGHEHDGKGNNKRALTLGTTEPIQINFFDLIGLFGNTLKGIILKRGISHNKQSIPPLNYLIQYLPLDKRVGEKYLKLFHLFDLNAKWLLTTPQEFRDSAWRKLNGAQSKDEVLDLVPLPPKASSNDEGFVVFLQGGFGIVDVAYFDTAVAMAALPKGFVTGFRMRGVLGDVFASEVKGSIVIVPENKQQPVVVKGSGNLTFCGKEILKGEIAVDTRGLMLSGSFDLFPQSTVVRITGNVNGVIQKDRFDFQGAVSCRIGVLTFTAAQLTINNNEFALRATFFGQKITLLIQRKGSAIRFLATMDPIRLGSFFQITDFSGQSGPVCYVEMNQLNYVDPPKSVVDLRKAQTPPPGWFKEDTDTGWASNDSSDWLEEGAPRPVIPKTKNPFLQSHQLDAWEPSGNRLKIYISGRIKLLGLESSAHVEIMDKSFLVHMKGNLFDLFASELRVEGAMEGLRNIWEGEDDWQGDDNWLDEAESRAWKGDSFWSGEKNWIEGDQSDWNHFGACEFSGSITLLGASLKSTGELSIGPEESFGNIKLWTEGQGNSVFKGCTLMLSFQKYQQMSRVNLTINGDILEAALGLAFGALKNEVNKLLNGAIKDLDDFNKLLENKKRELANNAEARKKQADQDYNFWKGRLDDLSNILRQTSYDAIEQLLQRYINEARNKVINSLAREKTNHSNWFFNGDYRHPWDWVAYGVKQKFLQDAIWHAQNSIPELLKLAKGLSPLLSILYSIIRPIILELLEAAKVALKVITELRKVAIDGATAIANLALNIVQQGTGTAKGMLTLAKDGYNNLHNSIEQYVKRRLPPIRVVRVSIDTSLNQFKLNSFAGSVDLLITPLTGKPFIKTVTMVIDFNDLNKTARSLLDSSRRALGLEPPKI